MRGQTCSLNRTTEWCADSKASPEVIVSNSALTCKPVYNVAQWSHCSSWRLILLWVCGFIVSLFDMGFVINKIFRGQGLCFRKGNLLIFWNQRIYHPTFVIILNQSLRELCYAICCHDQVTASPLFGILLFHHPWSLKSTEKSLSWCIVISHQHPDFLPGHLMHFSQSQFTWSYLIQLLWQLPYAPLSFYYIKCTI